MSCRVIVVDAYDSFVHILVAYLENIGCCISLFRKDDPGLELAIQNHEFDMLLLGPGPGHPSESGYGRLLDINQGRLPVLGVCLGHQAIGLYYGCNIKYASRLMHGKTSNISHDGLGCFSSYGTQDFCAMRYHSIIVSEDHLPSHLTVSAKSTDDHYVMGIRHRTLPIEGVQFHPESIGTEDGDRILKNFINTYIVNESGLCNG
ncbi:anthranilate synthase component II [Polynucleobacter brandtiae]|uniref:Aminodeoxychorismate synthase glutamine amidotransferase subunit n=1 Tax=Polynucleobacter brandtiae TaxID=1938816 RepID=A0A2M8VY52_9BURK|nr:aminodeoxychorismate/anthranilate synthase component II [Polynucleobacter brandtiae]PJI82781.1 aminodeoxychorismate synthase glutamine amidotransferase subunit [Polynucleobacter brandtiae]